MSSLDFDDSVPDWLIEHPLLLAVLERFGIDYACGGKSLRVACGERGRTPEEVLLAANVEHQLPNRA